MHNHPAPRVLFILKQRMPGPYGTWSYSEYGTPLPSGLYISALEMVKGLEEMGIDCKLVHVVDNNSIDKEVHLYKPTHAIVEAFWVVPEKFNVLKALHPDVTWIVRNHSKPAFLANEGGMIGWAIDYLQKGVIVASNSIEAARDLKVLAFAANADPRLSVYLPNYYQTHKPKFSRWLIETRKALRLLGFNEGLSLRTTCELNVGCFGAVRPMKNHLAQAIAAIEVAETLGVKLVFWINSNRLEGKSDSFLRSIRELFKRFPGHELQEVDWMSHDDFLKLIKRMDIVTQVSNTETFNIVAADAVGQGVPVIGSAEIPWLDCEYIADPGSVLGIAKKLLHVLENSKTGLLQSDQLQQLRFYTERTKEIWARYLFKA